MDKKIKATLIGSLINLTLPPLKVVAGVVGNSPAMIADAIHSFSDLISDAAVYLFVTLADKPKDRNHDYGHGKYETLATLVIAVLLVAVAGIIIGKQIKTIGSYLSDGSLPPRTGPIAAIVALISVLSKEWLFQYTKRVAKQTKSSAILANAWHHRSDAFSSIATLIGTASSALFGGLGILLDPIAAIVVGIFIIVVGVKIGVPALRTLTEESLSDEVESEIIQEILSVSGVHTPHNLHTRLIGNDYAIEADIQVEDHMTVLEAHGLTERVEAALRKKYGPRTHIILHIEPLRHEPEHDYEP